MADRRAIRRGAATLAAAALVAIISPATDAWSTETRGAVEAAIARGARLSLEGRWDAAAETFESIVRLDPGDPAGAYFPAQVLHWRQYENELHPRHHAALEGALRRAIDLAEERLDANPRDARALLYGGQAMIELGRHEVLTGSLVGGGSLGEDGREWLERALEIEPTLVDATCPLGAYYYFASLVPQYAKVLDWLWFVPKGDRERGLALLARCRAESRLRALEARWLLFYVQGRFETPPTDEALSLGRALRAEFPDNAVIHAELVRLLLHRGAYAEAIAESERVEARAREGDATYDEKIGNLARFWRSRAQLMRGDFDAALAAVDRIETDTPYWLGAWLLLTRAQAADLRGDRETARRLYERVIDLDPTRRDPSALAEAERCREAPCRPKAP